MKKIATILAVMLFSVCGVANAQQPAKIEGTVTNTAGQPLAGINVLIKGQMRGTTTLADGRFSIAAANSDVLIFSMLGYQTREITVGMQTQINIILEEDAVRVEDVLIIGYGNVVHRESLTASISGVASDRLAVSAAANVSTALAGKVSGINFRQPDGQPGANTIINIRNMGDALFVIDGVQSTQGSFNNLDFNDIESISVLKDASAAIYGVQAANGVIVVTTKSGSRNSSQVNVQTYLGAQSWFRYPQPASADDYVAGHIQSATITGLQPQVTQAQIDAYNNGTLRGFDWYKFVVRSAAPQYYFNANASGGSDKVNYYVSLGGLDQTSVINNFGGFRRYNAQINVDARVNRRLKVSARFNGRYEDTYHPAVPGDDVWAAIFAIWRNPPTSFPYANNNPNYPTVTSNTPSTNFAILNYERSGYYDNSFRVGQLNFNAEYQITDELKVKALGGYYLGSQWYDVQEYTYDLYGYNEATDTYPVIYSLTNPFRQRIVGFQQQTMGQVQLMYDKKIDRHSISALLAAEIYDEIAPGLDTWSRPASNYINTIDFASLERYSDNKNTAKARAGMLGKVNYNYADRYYVEFTGRQDGSWLFRQDSRWVFLPSASAGWRISEENFYSSGKIADVMNLLKVRASFGQLGYDEIWWQDPATGQMVKLQPFAYNSGFNYGAGGAVIDGKWVVGAQTTGLATTTLSWIKVNMFDAGVDFGLFNDRLSGSVDYFYNLRSGLVGFRYDQLIPSETGMQLPPENLSSEIHTGFDGNIMWRDRVGEFNYSAAANFTYARHLTNHQYKPRYGNSYNEYRYSVWERYSGITWGYVSDGQFQSWDDIRNSGVDIDGRGNSTLRPGDIRYKDLNGDGIINEMDMRPIGYAEGVLPNLNFGLNLTAAYRGFDIACDFTGGAFGTYHVDYEMRNPFWDGGNSALFILRNQWRLSDITDPNSPIIPGAFPTAIVGNSAHSNYWVSDFWYRNISYVKLRNFEVGYTLPKHWLAKMSIKMFRVYLFGQNLFSIDNMGLYQIDPEVANATGIVYPTTRIMGAGIKIQF